MLFIAWLVALGATLGALFIGEVMGQVPCTLCWYQRIAMFPLAIVQFIIGSSPMNRRFVVVGALLFAVLAFGVGYKSFKSDSEQTNVSKNVSDSALIRFHSPIVGKPNAPVTIVEFFDPACEACRAFHPVVKEILSTYPDDVRVVIRYAAFHDGSDTAVKILESARKQNLFEPVLEALLAAQPYWASHDKSNLAVAWQAAEQAGLDVSLARTQIDNPAILSVLEQDTADVVTVGVNRTPTFFVNGLPLMDFGANGLKEMVRKQVEASKIKASS